MALTRITKGVIKPNENYDTHNINSTGIVTAIGLDVNGNGDISGNLNVGGVLTYEDVTSIDSVGIITAQKDIHVGAGVSAVGVGTFGSLDISGDIDVDGHTNLDNVSIAGVTTITNTYGYLYLEGLAPSVHFKDTSSGTPTFRLMGEGGQLYVQNTTNPGNSLIINTATKQATFGGGVDVDGDLDVDGHTELDNVNVSGVVTFTNSPNGIQMNDNARVSFGTSLKTSISYNASASRTQIRNWNDTLEIGYRNTEIHHSNVARLTFDSGNTFSNAVNTNFTGDNYSAVWIPSLDTFRFNDNAKLVLGTNGDTEMYHNNAHFYITNTTGKIRFTGDVRLNNDLDVDGHTNLDNVSISGVTTFTGGVYSNSSINLGGELNFTGNGHKYIDVATLNGSDTLTIRHQDGGSYETAAYFDANGGAYLQFNGSTKFATTNTGVTVTGTVAATSYTGDGSNLTGNTIRPNLTFSGSNLTVTNSGGASELTLTTPNNTDGGVYFRTGSTNAGAVSYLHSDNTMKFRVNSLNRLQIDSGGRAFLGVNPQGRLCRMHISGDNFPTVTAGGSQVPLIISNQDADYGLQLGAYSSGNGFLQATRNDGTASVYNIIMQPAGGNVMINTFSSSTFNGVGQTHALVVAGDSSDTDITDNYNAAITISNKDGTANNTAGLHFAREDTDGQPHYAGASVVAQFKETMNTGHYPKADLAFLTSTANNNAPSEKMRIHAEGYVTKPSNPCFQAVVNGGNVSAGSYVVFGSVDVNVGNDYNSSNGIFTAPVEGVYLFHISSIAFNNASTVFRFYLKINNGNTGSGNDAHLRLDLNNDDTDYAPNASYTYYKAMNANDTARVYFAPDDNSAQAYGPADYFKFAGHLVG